MKDENLKEILCSLEPEEIIKIFDKSTNERQQQINLILKEIIEANEVDIEKEEEELKSIKMKTKNYLSKLWYIIPEDAKKDLAYYFEHFTDEENN